MEKIKQTFAQCKREKRAALVAYVTAGYPEKHETPDIMLGMEAGGADLIELGMPFTDPIADGPTIQRANTQALKNGVTVTSVLDMVRTARSRGLRIPVLLMGYYNPLLQYKEDKMLRDAREAGVNGFIMVDLPPEEAIRFRDLCRKEGLSYVPLIAPATSDSRMKLLCKIADSFIYVVSRMGVTGATGKLSKGLPELLARVHSYSGNIPTALGFGISTREHFLKVQEISEGAVIGSQIITVLGEAPAGQRVQKIEEYCTSITGRKVERNTEPEPLTREVGLTEALAHAQEPTNAQVDEVVANDKKSGASLVDQLEALNVTGDQAAMPARFGEFGGQYVPESLMDNLLELEAGFNEARNDPKFWEEFRSYYPYMSLRSA
ncbi:bifunctional tryptophan synthase TRPB [Histoplasma capsulatum]|uniref:tryptophan synthase n=1 Tax=Ajellomyces capsulatus TaxID=5037 RepID=A0A8H8D3Y4_AJECA|nr:bifunctional tryptophan synthase TRPB [Histoplasma capsulatum]